MRHFKNLTPLAILTYTAVAAKNCTYDPLDYLNHPLAYLSAHPFLTAEIDELCRDIRRFTHLISDLNITQINATHPNLHLNVTEISDIVANVTAELSELTGNATLVNLCHRAEDVVDSCWPLVYETWKVNRPACKDSPLADETAAAEKNSTLVALCNVFVEGCNKNVTVTDAALAAADVNSTSTSTSTATSSSSTATATSKSGGAIQTTGLSSSLFASMIVVLIGVVMIG